MHLLSLEALDDRSITELLDAAERFHDGRCRGFADRHPDKVVCSAFYEPSTRTRLSFEAAAHRLGARVIGFSDMGTTSNAKGETLEDTVRVLSGYADALVIRHPEEGAITEAAEVATVPVVNAGDGVGEHPTQALLDLYTIRRLHGDLSRVSVAVVGDLRYGRTVHSLVPVLQRFGAKLQAVPAPGLGLPDVLGQGIPEVTLDDVTDCDIIYMTRVQEERFTSSTDLAAAKSKVHIDADWLQRTGSKASILHPLPRVDELDRAIDATPSAKYFEQARNGVPVRMAVLDLILGESA